MAEKENVIYVNDDFVLNKFNKDDLFKQEYYIHSKVLIYIKDHMKFSIEMNKVIQEIESILPEHMFKELDDIFIGDFQDLKKRNKEILYKEGALYISNEFQTNTNSLIYSIILGVGYSIINSYKDYFLNDNLLQVEFLKKRVSLCNLLKYYIDLKMLNTQQMLDIEYYDRLESIISSLMKMQSPKYKNIIETLKSFYITNFGIYSINNYIIDGYIELLYQKDQTKFKNICPELYNKLYNLFNYNLKSISKGEKLNAKNKYTS